MTTSISPVTREDVLCQDWQTFMPTLAKGSVDLILTDPPYAISRETGFSKFKTGVPRFAVSMDFGKWDHEKIELKFFTEACYDVLRVGGTAIIWYDVWKISEVEKEMRDAGFKMLRLIIWQKTNPVPLNQSATYLSNSREVAVVGVKSGKPTFHGKYDNGIYKDPIVHHDGKLKFRGLRGLDNDEIYDYPIPRHGGKKLHPTQKPIELFSELVRKHSHAGDLVIDPFMGSGTTGVAAIENGCYFKGCDIDKTYAERAYQRIKKIKIKKSKGDLFLELAKPDKEGFSPPVGIERFIGHYEGLRLGNGGSWCRETSALGKEFNIRRIKEGNKIVAVELHGYKKLPIEKPIPNDIKRTIGKKRCVVLATSRVEVDHKDGHRDDPRLSDIKLVREDDFQPLSKAANNAKRQHCKECRKSDKRFDARRLGYSRGYVRGDKVYEGTCVGCYWYDPYFFNQEISKNSNESND